MRTSCGQNFSSIGHLLLKSYCLKKPKLGPIGSGTLKKRRFFWVKSKMASTQKLKLVLKEVKTMTEWSYYRLCGNLC